MNGWVTAAIALGRGIWLRKRELSEISLLGYTILIITFFLQVAIARLLGTEKFGIYSATLATVALIEVPLIVRGAEVAIRVLGECWQDKRTSDFSYLARRMFRYDLTLYLSVSVTMIAAAGLVYHIFGFEPWLFIVLALALPMQAGLGVFKSYFTIFGKVREMIRYELLFAVLLAALNLTGIYYFGIYGLAASLVVSMLLKTLLAYLFTRKYLPQRETDHTAPADSLSLTAEGGYSLVRNLFSNGFNQIDIVLLGLLHRPEIVALYKVGKSLASLPIKISFPVWRYLQPRLLQAVQARDHAVERRVILSGAMVLLLAMVGLAPLVIYFGEQILVLLYGEAYRDSFRYFLVLIVGVWLFHGIAGWVKFWVVITHSRWFGIGLYASAFVAILVLGLIFGQSDALSMSYLVTLVMALMSAVSFVRVLRA